MKYDAFISYRHTELDMEIAKKIHSKLEAFKVPVPVQKRTGKKKIRRVFRDQEELPIGSDLDDNINSALRDSEYLIVICSPRTLGSEWVMKEIDTFIRLHDRKHVLAVLIEGEPWESFPKQLLVDDLGRTVEPLAADVRGATAKERNEKFKTEIMRLAAPLLGCTYDDLRQRHRERRIRKVFGTVAGIAGAVAVAGAGFGIYSSITASRMKQLAEEKTKLAEEKEKLAENMVMLNYDLEDSLAAEQKNQSEYLAVTALDLFEMGDREDAALVACAALPSEYDERPYITDAEYALSQILYAYDNGDQIGYDRLLKNDMRLRDMKVNADRSVIVAQDEVGAIYVWDTESWTRLSKIGYELNESGTRNRVTSIGVDKDSVYVALTDKLVEYDLYGNRIYEVPMAETIYKSEIFAEDGLAVCASVDTVYFVDLSTAEIIFSNKNENGLSYSTSMDYDSEFGYFAISQYMYADDKSLVSVFDCKNGFAKKNYECDGGTVYGVEVIDGRAYVLDTYANPENYFGKLEMYLTVVDCRDETIVWTDRYMVQVNNWGNFYALIEKDECDYEGSIRNMIAVGVDSHFRTYDADTGELYADTNFSSSVTCIKMTDSEYTYIGQLDGNIDIINIFSGKKFPNNTIDTGKRADKYIIGGGAVILMDITDSDITVLSYHTAPDLKTIVEDTESVTAILSTYEDYFATVVNPYSYPEFVFYDIAGNNIGSVKMEDYIIVNTMKFTADNTFMFVDYKDVVHWINPVSGLRQDATVLPPNCSDSITVESVYVTTNRKYAVLEGYHNFSVFDLETRERLFYENLGYTVGCVAVSEDGSTAYVASATGPFTTYDIATGETNEYSMLDDVHVAVTDGRSIVVSDDGLYVAISCNDGYLRTIDLTTGSITLELDVYSQDESYLEFIPTTHLVMVHGRDEYIKVVDAESGYSYTQISANFSTIESVTFDQDDMTIAVKDARGVTLLSEIDYKPLAFVPRGIGYVTSSNTFILSNYNGYCTTRYKDYNQLIEEVGIQFPGAELTYEERDRYNIL